MLDDRMESESSRDNNAPVWDSRKNKAAWELYLRDMKEEIPVYAAPGRETDLRGMPAACGIVGDLDPAKDETVLYFAKMKKAGVPVSLRVYHGCFHSFETTAIGSNVAMNALRYLTDSFRYAQKHYFARNEAPAEEIPAEEIPAEEIPAEEIPIEEISIEEIETDPAPFDEGEEPVSGESENEETE